MLLLFLMLLGYFKQALWQLSKRKYTNSTLQHKEFRQTQSKTWQAMLINCLLFQSLTHIKTYMGKIEPWSKLNIVKWKFYKPTRSTHHALVWKLTTLSQIKSTICSKKALRWCRRIVAVTTAPLHSSLNSGSAQVQTLLMTCQRFVMVRISDNNPDWK